MYKRIVWGKVRPGQWEQYEEAYNNVLRPGRENIRGLKGRWLARDIGDPDAGYSVSLWESTEALERYGSSDLFRPKGVPALQALFVNDVKADHCEERATAGFVGRAAGRFAASVPPLSGF